LVFGYLHTKMTEVEIYNRLKELDKIIDPIECNELCGYISGFVIDYEESLHEMNLIISNKWLKIREMSKSNDQADKMLEISPEYQQRERVKLSMAQLKRMRSDLKDRFKILTYNR
jgi:hypothetical protein